MRISISITAIIFGIVSVTHSQPVKGTFVAGGTLEYHSAKNIKVHSYEGTTGKVDHSFAKITPRIGYFISDKVALGASLGYGQVRTKFEGVNRVDDIHSFEVFGRYYRYASGRRVALLVQADASYTEEPVDEIMLRLSSALKFNVSPGIAYFPHQRLSVEFLLEGFYFEKLHDDRETQFLDLYEFGLNLDLLKPTFGINLYLGRTGERDDELAAIAPGKGVIAVSGQVRLGKRIFDTHNDDQSVNINALKLSVSMFVSDHISLGLNFGTGNNQVRTYDDVLRFADTNTGIFIRAHKIPDNSRLMMLSQLEVGKSKFIDGTTDVRGTVSLGLNYFLTSKLGLEMMFDAVSYTWRQSPNNEIDQRILSIGTDLFKPSLGLRYYFTAGKLAKKS